MRNTLINIIIKYMDDLDRLVIVVDNYYCNSRSRAAVRFEIRESSGGVEHTHLMNDDITRTYGSTDQVVLTEIIE
jgi:hypothetical protein